MNTESRRLLQGMHRCLGVTAAVLGTSIGGSYATADTVISDDYIIQGGACISSDCVNGEILAGTELRMKENNTRLHLIDSTATGALGEAWALVANDSTNGGESYMSFAVQSVDGTDDFVDDTQTLHVFRVGTGASDSTGLGPNAELVDDAVSLGTAGGEHRLANVAEALAETQALIKRQMELGGLGDFEARADAIDARLDTIEADIVALENPGGGRAGSGAAGPLGIGFLMALVAFARRRQGKTLQERDQGSE